MTTNPQRVVKTTKAFREHMRGAQTHMFKMVDSMQFSKMDRTDAEFQFDRFVKMNRALNTASGIAAGIMLDYSSGNDDDE